MGYTVGTKSFHLFRNVYRAGTFALETHLKLTKWKHTLIARTQNSWEQKLESNLGVGVKSGSTAARIQRLFTHVLQQADKDPGFRVEHRLCIISLYCLKEDNTEEEMRFPVLTDFLSKLLSLTLSHAVCCHTCRIE